MAASMDRGRSTLSIWLRRGLWLAPLLFLSVFFFYPLAAILSVSLFPAGELDLAGFSKIISTDYYLNTLTFTLGQAALSTFLTLLLAIPGAYVFTHYRFWGREFLQALAALPFVLPTVVVAAGFLALIGPRGVLNGMLMTAFHLSQPPIQLERTLTIILLAHVFYNYGVAFRIIGAFWAAQSPAIENTARVLGAHGWKLWWHVRLPLLRPALLAAGVLVFIYTFTSFGVIVVLGGPRFATIEVEIYRQIANLFDLPMAAALSLVQIGFMFLCLWIYTHLERRVGVSLQPTLTQARSARTPGDHLVLALNVLIIAALIIAPLGSLIGRSFTTFTGEWTLNNYIGLMSNPRGSVLSVPPIMAIGNSLAIASVTTLMATALGVSAARAVTLRRRGAPRWFETMLMLPLATSAVVLGFGFNIALDTPPLDLRSSVLLLPLAHTLVALPFVLRSVTPALRSIPPQVEDSARVLGAHGIGLFRHIHLPLISRALAVGAVFAFTISLGEFGASLFIARPDAPTLPIAIFRLLGQPGESSYGRALALSGLLLTVCALAFLLVEAQQKWIDRNR